MLKGGIGGVGHGLMVSDEVDWLEPYVLVELFLGYELITLSALEELADLLRVTKFSIFNAEMSRCILDHIS